ncbi:hypothetical protein BJV82DRAFT_101481 [Fennellomyces sp. T-0311]|nr:hypothetical protein BJV82DRAFT_101481 [Fennellomyces sp. T-0311]
MDSLDPDSSNDYENYCPPVSTFSRLEGGFANLGIHSGSGFRNRTRAVQTTWPSSLSAQKLREIIGCPNDDAERHPNLDMILDHDNKISFDNPLPDIFSQESSESTDLDDDLLLSTPPPLIGKLFEDDIDEFRDDTSAWISQIYHDDEDYDVSDTDPLPPTMEQGHDKENQSVFHEEYRRKNTRRAYVDDDCVANERNPLGQMVLEDWPTQVILEAERRRPPLEVVATTSTGSNSSNSTIGSRRFVRSLSPSRKGKERAWSPETLN